MSAENDMANKSFRKSGPGVKNAAIALRAENCARILVILSKGPMISANISAAAGLSQQACYCCLRYMRDSLHQIHADQRDSLGRNYWTLGTGDAPLRKRSKQAAVIVPPDHRRVIVPARQMGMVRDGLLAAFFGPAGEQRP